MYSCLAAVLLLLLTATGGLAGMESVCRFLDKCRSEYQRHHQIGYRRHGHLRQVQGWGRCHPTDCDWGTVQAQAFAPGVSSDILSGADTLIAVFDAGFSETTLVIKPAGNRLNVDSYDRFKDNSGRSNYLASYTFQKAPDLGTPTSR